MNTVFQTIKEMEEYFGDDEKRIKHALSVLNYTRTIMQCESPENKMTVEVAAILHDIGIHEAERKHNSTAGHYQEIEGPPIAKRIMEKLNYNDDMISEVCDIIAHHHTPGVVNTVNFQILYEADWIENLQDDFLDRDIGYKKKIIEKHFKTKTGIAVALNVINKKT
jgi:HD superfamily phosphohydrolase YqeK